MSPIIEDIINENKLLHEKIAELTRINIELKLKLQHIQDTFNFKTIQNIFSIQICEYFNTHNSLKKTTEKFYFNNVRECYQSLVEYYGCSDSLQYAYDYDKYYNEIFGNEYNNANNDDNDDSDE